MQRWQYFLLILSFLLLQSCISPRMSQELQLGKITFADGNYKKAFHQLLPVAVCGRAEAQYAVGYMYYYGYGVAEDAESGIFWIHRAAAQHYPPAIAALQLIHQQNLPPTSQDHALPVVEEGAGFATLSDGQKKTDMSPWVIRLGSFKSKENAKHLVATVHSAGYKAFLQPVTVRNGIHTNVYIGPIYKEARAKQISAEIEQKMHLPNLVLKYIPHVS